MKQETIDDVEISEVCDILNQYSSASYDDCRLAVAHVLTKNITLFVTACVPITSKYINCNSTFVLVNFVLCMLYFSKIYTQLQMVM